MTSTMEIPKLPSRLGTVKDFIPYISSNPKKSINELLEPYKAFESELRKVYAQEPGHASVQDGTVNLVPIFAGYENEVKIRARLLEGETEDEKSKYIMQLQKKERKPNDSPAIVSSLKEFQKNFNLFSESSLADLDWSNIVAAGSAVTTALLPVPDNWGGNKKSQREYYHEKLAPASDVDLFIYGLNEEQAIEKIKQIERNIKDSILHETTTIRTKNAITIASQYPTRHVQIVLRLYDSISQIITGFDVDCACVAYNGEQVFGAPRAIASFITQCNTIDLTRRSPSYENRLSKYRHRGFEVHWPLLDRSRIDPTIFERSFGRTQGLSRLLILEKLPKTRDRDAYMDQRRAERGRPQIHRNFRASGRMSGNIKEWEEDDVAEWVEQEEVSSYHTFTVPYGPKYHAGKINRLMYAKDLLLNAEWNQPDDREVYLHRHPCFIGTAEEIIQDCCGYCPVPKTEEEIAVHEEESKKHVSGELKFLVDDPGRQEIGSFNPITDDEWTTMAYVGDTARLCQAIVDHDLEHVEDWCSQEGIDVNRRDYTGRTPLHLAVMASTAEIVQCLVDHGARLIARLVDGRTALHIAAARGNADMVKILMNRSLANEEEEDLKQDARRASKASAKNTNDDGMDTDPSDSDSEASEITLGSDSDTDSVTMGSFVKVDTEKQKNADDGVPDDSTEDPDIYEIDVIAWDYGLSPLHVAIMNGHLDIIELLVSDYGADVLLPVKLIDQYSRSPRGAIMTIILAINLPPQKAKSVIKLLLELGATSAQGDMNHTTVLHYLVAHGEDEILDVLLTNDRPASLSVLNNIAFTSQWGNDIKSPLITAVEKGNQNLVQRLLELGTHHTVTFENWVKAYLARNEWAKTQTPENNLKQYRNSVVQPIIAAACKETGKIVEYLLAKGADPSSLEKTAYNILENPQYGSWQVPESLLDIIQKKLKTLREYKEPNINHKKPEKLRDQASYTSGLEKDTYQYWSAVSDFQQVKLQNTKSWETFYKNEKSKNDDGVAEKREAISNLIQELESAKKSLIAAGAKPFVEMYPDIPKKTENNTYQHHHQDPSPYETKHNFRVPDLNDTNKGGYLKLFEAAWDNDLETIKSLTLAPWTSPLAPSHNTPLKIAVQDSNGFSPFSLAILRGHKDLAKRIVEICITQYSKDDIRTKRERWNTRTDEDDEDDDSECSNEDDLPIYSELVSDKFTIDNLGEVASVVKSDIMPLTMVGWICSCHRLNKGESHRERQLTLLEYAVETDDMDLLKFIIKLGGEQQALLDDADDAQKCYTIGQDVFLSATKLGRTNMLAEMIKTTGVGVPFKQFIKSSGVELMSKPKYYQGLSIGGKKRADWAQAPGYRAEAAEQSIPPVLQAAQFGNLDSIDWFMSDAPMRQYRAFADSNKKDKRIQALEESEKGFEKTLTNWLRMKSDLLLHCAIMYKPKDSSKNDYLNLIKHIVSLDPAYLERKSSEGWTPLHIATSVQRKDAISYLISCGANQRSRDRLDRNVIHSLVQTHKKNVHLRSFIELFDKEAVKEMMVERCTIAPGALTPLALWMTNHMNYDKNTDCVSVLCSFSNGEELEMINGEGDLPLHVAIKNGLSSITAFFLSLNPTLLYRENATGRTPLEMSRDIYTASCVENAPNVSTTTNYHPGQYDHTSIVHRSAQDFMKQDTGPEESKKRTWEICEGTDHKTENEHSRKRRLVSLYEANEVARRVAGMRTARNGESVTNGGSVVGSSTRDIVSMLLAGDTYSVPDFTSYP